MSEQMKLRYMGIPIFSALFQLFIKLTAAKMEAMDFGTTWLMTAAVTPWLWAALVCEVFNFILWLDVLSKHNLSKVFPLSATCYVLVVATSWFVFHEPILPLQLVGSTLILAGVWMIGTAGTQKEATL